MAVVNYRCTALAVTPKKTEFYTDEDLTLRVTGTVQRRSVGVGISLNWFAYLYLNSISAANKLLTMILTHAPWTEVDTESFDKTVNLGKQLAGTKTGKIIVACSG